MKFLLLIISSLFATNLIKNANSVGEGGKESKLYKSFDEIFGKGWDDESNDSKDLNCRHVKEEVQDGQAPNISDQKNIDEILKQKFDEIYDENWSEDENSSAPSPDDIDQNNSKKILSDQNNSTDQNESVDQNESNKSEKIESDQQKHEIIQKFREIKDGYRQKEHTKEWVQIESKISNSLGVSRSTIYKWVKELGLTKLFSELEKREILKQFDEIKRKCKKAKLKNISKNELDEKIAIKLGVSRGTIIRWKRKFGLSISKKKFSKETKLDILKKYAKIKGKNPKMSNAVIADILNISLKSLCNCSTNEHVQIERKISNGLGVSRRTIYNWKNELGLSREKLKFSEFEKRKILEQFDEIKSKCKKAKIKNSKNELDEKIAKKFGFCFTTIKKWKREFGLSVSNKKFSDATKIEILKKYAKIKGENPKMSDVDIADLLKISRSSLKRWKAQFNDENKHL